MILSLKKRQISSLAEGLHAHIAARSVLDHFLNIFNTILPLAYNALSLKVSGNNLSASNPMDTEMRRCSHILSII